MSIYNVNTYCNLLCAIKYETIWILFEGEHLRFLLKLLYIKVWHLINVNTICGLPKKRWNAAKWVMYGMPSLNVSFIFLWKNQAQNFHLKLLSQTVAKGVYYWKKHKIPKIRVFLCINLKFTIRVFTWGTKNDPHMCKNRNERTCNTYHSV